MSGSPVFRHALLAAAGLAVAWLPWVPVLIGQTGRVKADYWIDPVDAWSLPLALDSLFFFEEGPDLHRGRAALTTALVVAGVLLLLRRGGAAGRYVAYTGAVPPLLALLLSAVSGRSIFMPRYLYFSYISLVLGLAILVSWAPRIDRWAVVAWLSLSFTGPTATLIRDHLWTGESGVRKAVNELAGRLPTGGLVLSGSSRIFFPAKYHAGRRFNVRQVDVPGQLSHYGGGQIIAESEVIDLAFLQRLRSSSEVWLIETSAFGGFQVTVPTSWVLVDRWQYKEALPHLGWVFVFRYRVPAPAERG